MSRPQTPPHVPKYGVHVSSHTINSLIEHGFPGAKLISIEPLQLYPSYNNRLYFLKVARTRDCSLFANTDELERELVLRANGRFFGADKIQNEVGWLRIMKEHCRDIPTPEALAWSEDGSNVVVTAPSASERKQFTLSIQPEDNTHGGWMLLTRLPGKPLSSLELDEPSVLDVATQLGSMVASWRRTIPPQQYVGNLQFHNSSHSANAELLVGKEEDRSFQGFVVRGILMDDIKISTPIASVREQYEKKLEQKMKGLSESDTYTRNRALIPRIREFIDESLPVLDIDVPPSEVSLGGYVLTHYDLSPRNVLISGSPPKITGIVDFEFAGFFSEPEEFLNDSVGNDGDWSDAFYDAYLAELEKHGVATPRKGIRNDVWDTVHSLEKLAENIAPWWLPGSHTGDALDDQLAQAEVQVLEQLGKLKQKTRPSGSTGA